MHKRADAHRPCRSTHLEQLVPLVELGHAGLVHGRQVKVVDRDARAVAVQRNPRMLAKTISENQFDRTFEQGNEHFMTILCSRAACHLEAGMCLPSDILEQGGELFDDG